MESVDVSAEKAVIGSCLRDNVLMDEAMQMVAADDFSQYANQVVWRHMVRLWSETRSTIDLVTLARSLKSVSRRDGGSEFDDVGGPYLVDLWDGAPVVENLVSYCRIVSRLSQYRLASEAGASLAKRAEAQIGEPAEILVQAQDALGRILERGQGDGPINIDQCVKSALEAIDRRRGKADGEIEEAVPTGWADLDHLLAGFHKSEMVVLAARPSVGKTLLAGNIIANAALRGFRVFFASLEQPGRELGVRWLCQIGGIDSWRCRKGALRADEQERMLEAAELIRNWPVVVDDKPSQTMGRIAANSRRVRRKSGLDLVVIDYLQIVRPDISAPRHDQVADISRRAKQLARDLDIPVVCLAQLNRESEKMGDSKPKMSQLRESGNIEQDADTVLLLHKPAPAEFSETDLISVEVAKQRNGPRGEVTLVHHKRQFRVSGVETSVGADVGVGG